ncbi:nitrile hydratase subunit beta [Polymorphum gilvum]|uniref:Nitrile hydratase subunit beta n=1 Tax=Polymorphum gilvum (strain LMG 25793 / CGMCC 1.9160 / SL003B-26A1) TaxID=991905 RepID=F2IWE9_POLGS|nr:nitrile hydratase subunit beta [Polymorphum gilvum]ADZ69248.1 Nitrile hydratase, beta subunit [Polymorphum gilvum SL003B-26A1]
MNGAQDLGGMMGFGPVQPEPHEPPFHAEWERRAFAITLAMGAAGSWSLDASRFARESLPPARYLTSSYYQIWLAGLERLLEERGLVGADEIATGHALTPPKPVRRVLKAADVAATLGRGGPVDRPPTAPARFAVGDAVLARNMHPEGHTRLPRYVRGRAGVVEAIHGCHVFPDSNAAGRGEQPSWLYGIAFRGRELWGEGTDPRLVVRVDLWEPYLEGA